MKAVRKIGALDDRGIRDSRGPRPRCHEAAQSRHARSQLWRETIELHNAQGPQSVHIETTRKLLEALTSQSKEECREPARSEGSRSNVRMPIMAVMEAYLRDGRRDQI